MKVGVPLHSQSGNELVAEKKRTLKWCDKETRRRKRAGALRQEKRAQDAGWSKLESWLSDKTEKNKQENKKQRRVWSWLRMNASDRLNTCKSRGSESVAIHLSATGARVSNAYATYPLQGNNREKFRLIPHTSLSGIGKRWKIYR